MDEYRTFYADPSEGGKGVCLACLRAVGIDPGRQHYQPSNGPCWACQERAAVVLHQTPGAAHLCMVCQRRGRVPVRIVLGARRSFHLGHLCRTCARLALPLCERRRIHTV